MIDLNTVVSAVKQEESVGYDVIPEGKYLVEVVQIDEWEKKSKKNALITRRDERGFAIKDEKGKVIKDKVDNLEWYQCNVRFKIIEGDYANRIVFSNLTTHPDALFMTQGFLYAVGLSELPLNKIQETCLGRKLIIDVYHSKYTKKEIDKTTGLEVEKTYTNARVRTHIRPDLPETLNTVAGI